MSQLDFYTATHLPLGTPVYAVRDLGHNGAAACNLVVGAYETGDRRLTVAGTNGGYNSYQSLWDNAAERDECVANLNVGAAAARAKYHAAAPAREAARQARDFARQESQIRWEIDEINFCEPR